MRKDWNMITSHKYIKAVNSGKGAGGEDLFKLMNNVGTRKN